VIRVAVSLPFQSVYQSRKKKSRPASGSTTAAAKKITTVKKSTDAQLDARYFIPTEKKITGYFILAANTQQIWGL
jgi:hypothetical protein